MRLAESFLLIAYWPASQSTRRAAPPDRECATGRRRSDPGEVSSGCLHRLAQVRRAGVVRPLVGSVATPPTLRRDDKLLYFRVLPWPRCSTSPTPLASLKPHQAATDIAQRC